MTAPRNMVDSRRRPILLYSLVIGSLLAFLVIGQRLQSQWGGLEPSIVAFELASTPDAVVEVLDGWLGADRDIEQIKEHLRGQIELDFWFIPAYVLAASVWGFWLTRWRGRWLISMKWMLLALPVIAGMLDVIENLALLDTLENYPRADPEDTVRASWAAGAKFILLALGAFAVAAGAWRKMRVWANEPLAQQRPAGEPAGDGTPSFMETAIGKKLATPLTKFQGHWDGLEQRWEVQKKKLVMADRKLYGWPEILEGEQKAIAACRKRRDATGPYDGDDGYLGLALSGGGIRSATFNLGLLQALAKVRLLRHLDYLSTVSGGGYIGGWLQRWILAKGGVVAVEEELDAPEAPEESGSEARTVEPPAVGFLRRYSNYLTPRVGVFTADTWTTVATYGRNLLLNLVILVCSGGAVLLIPRILAGLFDRAPHVGRGVLTPSLWPMFCASAAGVLGVFAVCWMGFNLAHFDSAKLRRAGGRLSSALASQQGVLLTVVTPLAVAAVLATVWLYQQPEISAPPGSLLDEIRSLVPNPTLRWSLMIAVTYAMAWALAILVAGIVAIFWARNGRTPDRPIGSGRIFNLGIDSIRRYWQFFGVVVVSALPAGLAAGVAVHALGEALHTAYAAAAALYGREENLWYILTAGPPAILVLFTLLAVVHIGLMGRAISDELREWMARIGAWLLITGLVWFCLFGLSVFGSVLVSTGPQWLRGVVASGWLGVTLTGVLAGKGAAESEGRRSLWRDAAIKISPYIFIVGLVAFLSVGLEAVLSKAAIAESEGQASEVSQRWTEFWGEEPQSQRDVLMELRDAEGRESASLTLESVGSAFTWSDFRNRLDAHNQLLLAQTRSLEPTMLWLILALATVVLSRRVDINEFSMHRYYRNRLVRCFLGASNTDRAYQKLTGFDAEDDISLAAIAENAGVGDPSEQETEAKYSFPYPILNTALNLVHGKELAWQERKAASFVMSPLYCGFKLSRVAAESRASGGFRRTRSFSDPGRNPLLRHNTGGITLGTAMAISGAAASPNMGFRSSPALSFLLTVFNVRLGWWVGNPTSGFTWRLPGPRLGLFHLIKELFGLTSADSSFSYLSDGGHFDNLGIYELARRRCRLIIASDVGTDPNLQLQDLGNAIRKCRTDLGAEIDIDVTPLMKSEQTGYSGQHCVAGTITYQDASRGVLLYIKSSLTGGIGEEDNEPADVLQYRAQNSEFPHESTLDQFFGESQFESYRVLGRHIGEVALASALPKKGGPTWTGLEERLLAAWGSPRGGADASPEVPSEPPEPPASP